MPVSGVIKGVISGPICASCKNIKDTRYDSEYYCSECEKEKIVRVAFSKHRTDKFNPK
jgi:predicted RNA-binding Zn-ribbon protein involved in translation (DUF1610 family)